MSAEMSASLSRQKKARSLDLSLKRKSNSGGPVLSNGNSHFPLSADLSSDAVPLPKRMTEQRLPGKFFVIDGLLLLLLGFIRLFVSFWHEYYCALWSGGLVSSPVEECMEEDVSMGIRPTWCETEMNNVAHSMTAECNAH